MLQPSKGLATLRKAWSQNSLQTPFIPTQQLPDSSDTYAEFSLRMVLLAQQRRHARRKPAKNEPQ